MIRSLWSAATGMNAQQTNVDTIANNLANVNTVGYKSQVSQFKSLLYQTLQTKTTTAEGAAKPVTSQVGLGVRNSSINQIFTQGSLIASESGTSFAIEGDGFFAVKNGNGEINYTRNGDFIWGISPGKAPMLTTTDGNVVLDNKGNSILLNGTYVANKITISSDGTLMYPDENNNLVALDHTIGIYQFRNPGGLERQGDSLWAATAASGAAINESTNEDVTKSKVVQGYLEGSNVKVADEMVNLIVAQRAYEMNSKAITTSDEMLQQANNLKR
ncbi:flagellar basal-body rod protein FlgG [Kineothrix alysoides]|uniref:Flagellar basal-body rod protein FlgG n=1 Tax=Kineothrix alysoides TaxID=1469948 RepID=A0A4R1R282_9FIRM|nr:flagellar hook-basal body protein [Kineothrix alysoides]TCL59480.1 flagellar basal-body rod protein FlgG [Kineothrix alysoides]